METTNVNIEDGQAYNAMTSLVSKQFACYHHANFIFLSIILWTITKTLKLHLGQQMKDGDSVIELNIELLHFELFINYKYLILTVVLVSNGVQILLSTLLQTILEWNDVLYVYLGLAFVNGITMWWTLVQLKRTSYRKSKLLWLCGHCMYLIPYLLLNIPKDLMGGITWGISISVQLIGILFGMAIGSIKFRDAYGEYKQQFYDNIQQKNTRQQITFTLLYGLLPYLVIIKANKLMLQGSYISGLDLFYLSCIQYYQNVIMTYFDEKNLKTNWAPQAIRLGCAPFIYIILHQLCSIVIYSQSITLEQLVMICTFNYTVLIVSCGAASISALKIQKYIQEQRKVE